MHTTYTESLLYKQKQNSHYVCVNFQRSCTTPKPWKPKYKQKRYFTWLQLPTVHVHKEKQKQITFDFMFPAEHLFYKKNQKTFFSKNMLSNKLTHVLVPCFMGKK